MPGAERKFKHEGKIQVVYDPSRKQTVVALHPYALVTIDRPPFLLKAITVVAIFPGERLTSPPEKVELGVISQSRTGYDFDEDNELMAVADGEQVPLGVLKRFKRNSVGMPPRLHYREDLSAAIPYDTFLKLIKAKKLSLRAGKKELRLDDEHLEALRDLASRLDVQ